MSDRVSQRHTLAVWTVASHVLQDYVSQQWININISTILNTHMIINTHLLQRFTGISSYKTVLYLTEQNNFVKKCRLLLTALMVFKVE
jgi:hypothetical protein